MRPCSSTTFRSSSALCLCDGDISKTSDPGELVAFAKAFSAAVVDFPACRWQSHSWRLDRERMASRCHSSGSMPASVIRYPLVMQVNPSFPAKSVPEFISYVKSNPGKISYGSGGIGTPIHVASELFKMMAGVDMIHVPYRGGAPAMTDLMAGQVQVVFNPVPESTEFIRAGKLRPLAVTTATRSEVLPDVPTVGDFVPGYEASALQGIGAPKETSAEIVDKLNKEINAGLVDPKLKARFADLGATVFPGSSSDFAKFMTTETEKWAKVIKFSGAKAD